WVSYRQRWRGIEVMGGSVGLLYNDGRLALESRRIFPVALASTRPVVDSGHALAIAKASLSGAGLAVVAVEVAGELVIFPEPIAGGVRARLGWRSRLRTDPIALWETVIPADGSDEL